MDTISKCDESPVAVLAKTLYGGRMGMKFFEVQEVVTDAAEAASFFERIMDGTVLFRGKMMGLHFVKMKVSDLTLVFIEDPDKALPEDPHGYIRRHLGFRVADLDKSIKELTARGAEFVITPAIVEEFRKSGGKNWVQIDYAHSPLSSETSSKYSMRVAIFKGPGGLFIELNELNMPPEIDWHRDTDL
jgi:hypothetical protein